MTEKVRTLVRKLCVSRYEDMTPILLIVHGVVDKVIGDFVAIPAVPGYRVTAARVGNPSLFQQAKQAASHPFEGWHKLLRAKWAPAIHGLGQGVAVDNESETASSPLPCDMWTVFAVYRWHLQGLGSCGPQPRAWRPSTSRIILLVCS